MPSGGLNPPETARIGDHDGCTGDGGDTSAGCSSDGFERKPVGVLVSKCSSFLSNGPLLVGLAGWLACLVLLARSYSIHVGWASWSAS